MTMTTAKRCRLAASDARKLLSLCVMEYCPSDGVEDWVQLSKNGGVKSVRVDKIIEFPGKRT